MSLVDESADSYGKIVNAETSMIANEHIIGILIEKTQSSASDRALRKKLPNFSVEQV